MENLASSIIAILNVDLYLLGVIALDYLIARMAGLNDYPVARFIVSNILLFILAIAVASSLSTVKNVG